jgi:hypothetical protein
LHNILWKLKQISFYPVESLVTLTLPLFHLSLPLLHIAPPLVNLKLPFVTLALQRKSFLIISGNLLDERGLASNEQGHRFL